MNHTQDFSQIKFNQNKVIPNKVYVKLNFTKAMAMKTFGDYFKNLRELHKLSQPQLAERTGITKATVSMLENNKIKQPRLETLSALGKPLNKTGEELLGVFYSMNVNNEVPVPKPIFDSIQRSGQPLSDEDSELIAHFIDRLTTKNE